MVQINFAQKQVNAKVVYYGPGMSGKTTNLEIVHQRAPSQNRGDLTSISTDGDRTLFFDFMPLDLGTVAGMRTCFQIYTVPGQVYYNSTRKLVLQGVDGVVFVADSSAAMLEENLESLRNLEQNLNEYGKSLATVPHVIQFNKRDLPDAMSMEDLNRLLNLHNAPFFEAIANTGQGVFPTLKALAARVLETIHSNSGRTGANAPQPAAPIPNAQPAPQPAVAQAAPAVGKTGYYPAAAPTASPAAVVAAQRALQQTGFHAALQAPHRAGGPLPPPLGMTTPAQTPELARTHVHAPPGPAAVPNHPQAHAAAAPARGTPAPANAHAPGQGNQHGGLRMASPASAPHGQGMHGMPQSGGSGGGHHGTRPEAGGAKRPGPATAARPQSKGEARPSPTSRPAPAPVAAQQAQPRGKSKAWVYASIFVLVALGVGVVVAKMVLKVF